MNKIAQKRQVVAIASGNSKEEVEAMRRSTRMAYPVLLDSGSVAQAYDVVSSPTCILIEAGVIRYRGKNPPENLQ